jgi:hypothetical protein
MQAAEAGGKGERKGGSQAIARQSLLFSLEIAISKDILSPLNLKRIHYAMREILANKW